MAFLNYDDDSEPKNFAILRKNILNLKAHEIKVTLFINIAFMVIREQYLSKQK